MCGIVGVISLKEKSVDVDLCKALVDILEHRGPDDSGYLYFHTGARHQKNISFHVNLTNQKFKHINETLNSIEQDSIQQELHEHDYDLFFGFRRLSILDLTSMGHQPMSDLSKNIWLIFNGEIYNFKEIREELKKYGHKFKSKTDSEVIIYSYIQWGFDCVKKFNGMFAFAIYDNLKKILFLCRDRYGIKPLYWTLTPNQDFIFASEIKSIIKYKSYKMDIDKEGIIEYFTFQNFFTNKTLYKDIFLLEPGNFMIIDLITREVKKFEYWDFNFANKQKEENLAKESFLIDKLKKFINDAVKRNLISDVEVGCYLSGGIDTGIISCIASKYKNPLLTFTIGFDLSTVSGLEISYDERNRAEKMSYLFETEHYEMVLKAGDMEKCFDKLVYHLEEPRVGQSYPNFYSAKLASKFVKVVLSGTGGDELFAGYPWRYQYFSNYNEFIEKYYSYWNRLLKENELKEILTPIKEETKNFSTKEIFQSIINKQYKKFGKKGLDKDTCISLCLYLEAKTFLHGLLIVEDKLSMAHSLETRVPFLDNELVNFSLKIENSWKIIEKLNSFTENEIENKIAFTNGKYILRLLSKKLINDEIWNLPKQGFSAPDASWFKGKSIEFVKRNIMNKNAPIYEFLNRKKVYELLMEHLEGKKNRRLLIWSLLYFNKWLETFML